MPGKATRRATPSSSRKKKGSAARATSKMLCSVRPWMTNRLKPTGGVICAISTTITMKMPNQMRSMPA